MPTYEYACRDCGEHIEVSQSFNDDPLTECPACSGTLRKVFQPVGIAFKGSGFYKTDSRSSGKSTTKAAGNGSTDSTSSKPSESTTSSDSSTPSSTPSSTEAKSA